MTCIIKIAREIGLYKDCPNQNSQLILQENEDENTSACDDPDQPPMFLGETTSSMLFPKRRRYCEESQASLIGSSNLGALQIPLLEVTSVTDDVTSMDKEGDEYEHCECGSKHCYLNCPSEKVVLVQCSNSSIKKGGRNKSTLCKSGIRIFQACETKICRMCYNAALQTPVLHNKNEMENFSS